MAMRIPSFHSISRISEWLVTLSVGIIITSIITLILTSYENLQFLFVGGTDDALYEMDAVVGSISSIIEFIVIIIALYWFYRANQNIHSFGAKEISSPIMTVIWWFVPILQLWKPYKIAQQIWKASNPETWFVNWYRMEKFTKFKHHKIMVDSWNTTTSYCKHICVLCNIVSRHELLGSRASRSKISRIKRNVILHKFWVYFIKWPCYSLNYLFHTPGKTDIFMARN